MNPKSTTILKATFDLPLHAMQLPQFRGAVAQSAGTENELFHNHNNNSSGGGYHYRYPLVQYKLDRGKACMVGIGEGVDAIFGFLLKGGRRIVWQGREQSLRILSLSEDEHAFEVGEERHNYFLNKWLALNAENYEKWRDAPGLAQRIALLDQMLAANLIALGKGLGVSFGQRFEANITRLHALRPVRFHGVSLLAFNADISTNLHLPHHIGIGKAASHGYGKLLPLRQPRAKGHNAKHPAAKMPAAKPAHFG